MKGLVLFVFFATLVSPLFACVQPIEHYITMGCTPSSEQSGDGCPIYYTCPNLSDRQSDKCYLFGNVYDIGQDIPQDQWITPCESLSCQLNDYDNTSYILSNWDANCVYPWGPDCVTQYYPGQCCPTGMVCGDARNDLAKCSVSGQSYYEGEQIYSDYDSCQSCYCTRNYSASEYRPVGAVVCIEKKCGFEVYDSYALLNGAAPVYREGGCCPDYWRWPTNNDKIAGNTDSNNDCYTGSPLTCTYGNLTMNIGDSLIPVITYSGILKCACAIPPLAYCMLEKDHISRR